MKPGVSSLNPYAAAYIPLSQRANDGTSLNVQLMMSSSSQSDSSGTPGHFIHSPAVHQVSDTYSPVRQPTHVASWRYPAKLAEKQVLDDEFEMVVEYLKMTFPDLSDQSLIDVYLENRGDLDATVDMLNQLEFDPEDSPENLPECLDIGDVTEVGHGAEHDNVKTGATGEASSSSLDTRKD